MLQVTSASNELSNEFMAIVQLSEVATSRVPVAEPALRASIGASLLPRYTGLSALWLNHSRL